MLYPLVLVRHGQSLWNQENRFTGWVDIDLTEQGILEARRAGQLLKALGYHFDIAYTSVLKRAIRTLWHIQDELAQMYIPVIHSWRLNERHYGALTGLNRMRRPRVTALHRCCSGGAATIARRPRWSAPARAPFTMIRAMQNCPLHRGRSRNLYKIRLRALCRSGMNPLRPRSKRANAF